MARRNPGAAIRSDRKHDGARCRASERRPGRAFRRGARIVPFTGAGISTECGIPDFRSPGGLWTKHAPIPFDQFLSNQEARDESWRRRFAMDETLVQGQAGPGPPGAGQLYHAGKIARRGDAEHRQPASGVRHSGRQVMRTARQHELCDVSRLRQALRAQMGEGSFDQSGRAPECVDVRRLHQDSDGRIRTVNAGNRDAARRRD